MFQTSDPRIFQYIRPYTDGFAPQANLAGPDVSNICPPDIPIYPALNRGLRTGGQHEEERGGGNIPSIQK
jgi:hypothetical protein